MFRVRKISGANFQYTFSLKIMAIAYNLTSPTYLCLSTVVLGGIEFLD